MLSFLPVGAKIYISSLAFLIGLFLGSGLNCLSYRMAHGLKWSSGRSKCPSCGHTLAPRDLVPLFSWLFLKGKCRYCKEKISARYPISELVMALSCTALLWRFGIGWELAVVWVLLGCLFCLSLIDMETLTIPDRFLLIPAVCRAAELLWEGGLSGLWRGAYPALLLGGAVLLLALIMDKVLKKESMGGGDIKLLFVLGLFFDLPQCLFLLVTACIVGIIAAVVVMRLEKDTPFPFGPSISIAAVVTLLIGEQVTSWYLGLF